MGAKAERLIADPAFQEASRRLKEKMLNGWENSKSDQVEEREEFFRMYKLMGSLENELQHVIDDGKVAAKQIEREEAQNG